MEKNKTFIKVFSIVLVCVFMIAFSTGYSLYKFNNPTQTTIPPSTGADDIGDQIEDTQKPTEPGGNTEDEEDQPQVPVYSNAFLCLEDAFALLDNCKGYKTTTTMTAITDILGMGSATQSVKEVAMLSGDFYFKETFANCTSSMGQNYYRYFYSDDNGENVEFRKTLSYSNYIPNWDYEVENITTDKQDIINNYDLLAYDIFSIRADKSNSRLIKFDRTSDKTYYIITMSYQTSKIPDKYLQNAKKEGGLSDLTYNSITLTYYIEKQTLYLRKIERLEDYSITKGVTLNVSASHNMFVNIIDQVIEPQKPSYCA